MKALKDFLSSNNIDFFLLPNSDEYFLEYLPSHQKRIEFLTGFSGSNATIIFSQHRHYFFTDGRYILQARQQLNLSDFEIINIADKSPISWLRENIKSSHKIAIDSNLVSKKFIDDCKNFVSNIIFLEQNPVDEIWQNKPQAINNKAFELPLNLVGLDFKSKKQKLVTNFNADALFISKPENVNWLLNIRGSDIDYTPLFLAQALLFKNGELVLFCEEELLKEINLPNTKTITKRNFQNYLKEISNSQINIQTDFNSTNYAICNVFEKNHLTYFHQSCPLEILKAVKNEVEIAGSKKSHQEDAIALIKFLNWLDETQENQHQIDEISAQEKLLEFRKESVHFLYPSFATISGFASNGAVIHYHAEKQTNKKFNINSLYLVDSGGQYFSNDFCGTTDITRVLSIGLPSPDMIENYTRVLKGHIALARVKFPRGTSGSSLDVLARFHLWNDLKDYAHGTGHGVGSFLSVHEGPCAISKNSHQALQEGMILSNEPGYYEEGRYGIRLENLMVVKKFDDKFLCFEALTLVPFEPDLINFQMLTYPEKKWLHEYHQNIFEFLKTRLNQDLLAWFNKKYGSLLRGDF